MYWRCSMPLPLSLLGPSFAPSLPYFWEPESPGQSVGRHKTVCARDSRGYHSQEGLDQGQTLQLSGSRAQEFHGTHFGAWFLQLAGTGWTLCPFPWASAQTRVQWAAAAEKWPLRAMPPPLTVLFGGRQRPFIFLSLHQCLVGSKTLGKCLLGKWLNITIKFT